MGSQFICSGLEDFLLWVVLGRETQSNTLLILSHLTVFSQFFWTPSSPNFLLFIAKVSGEIMITVTVSATEGPILSGWSGCLGERAVQHLWSWNLVPSWSIMFGNSVSRAYHDFPGHGSRAYPGKFNRSPLGIQYPKLVFILRQFQEGCRVTGPFRWACAQGQHGPGLKASMGLGSRPVWALGSRCRTVSFGLSSFGLQEEKELKVKL